MTTMNRPWLLCGLLALLIASPAVVAAERGESGSPATVEGAKTVDLFAGIASHEIDVQLIPKDSTEANVIITNKTKQPLTVRLPEAFAGVPVLAQNVGGRAGGGGANTSANQSMGGGMMGGMGGGMMGGMGMMNIAPEKVAKLKVGTVCLEHGKKDPRPGVPYEIRPIETVTTQPGVRELLVAMSKQRLSQRAAQAAAWHLANGLSWEQLASKRIEHLNGTSELWFHPDEVRAGFEIARVALVQAEQNKLAKKSADSANEPGVELKAAAE